MGVIKTVADSVLFCCGATYPTLKQIEKIMEDGMNTGEESEPVRDLYPRELNQTAMIILDVLGIIRSTPLDALTDPTGVFRCSTTCGRYAKTVWDQVFKVIQGKSHGKIFVIRFDIQGGTVDNKSTCYAGRYEKIANPPDNLVNSPKIYFDDHPMPMDFGVNMKSFSCRRKLFNYLVQFLLRKPEQIPTNWNIIIDGVLWTPDTLCGLKVKITSKKEKKFYERSPLCIKKDSEGTIDLGFLKDGYISHVGESDMGVFFWSQNIGINSVVISADGDIPLVSLLVTDRSLAMPSVNDTPPMDFNLFVKRYRSINTTRIEDTINGCDEKKKYRYDSHKCAFYIDVKKMVANLNTDLGWLCCNDKGSASRLLLPIESLYDKKITEKQQVYPVILFVALCMMSGNDYNRKIPRKSHLSIIEYFCEHPELFRRMIAVQEVTITSNPSLYPDYVEDKQSKQITFLRYGIVFSEYARLVTFLLLNKTQIPIQSSTTLQMTTLLLEKSKYHGNPMDPHNYVQATLPGLRAACANLAWTLGYFSYGCDKNYLDIVPNSLQKDPQQKSLYGWAKMNSAAESSSGQDVAHQSTVFLSDTVIETHVYWSYFLPHEITGSNDLE